MVHKDLMSKRELKAYEKLEKQMNELNSKFSVGESVIVTKDDGTDETDSITNEFTIVSGSVCAWLKKNRCYLAERVKKSPF